MLSSLIPDRMIAHPRALRFVVVLARGLAVEGTRACVWTRDVMARIGAGLQRTALFFNVYRPKLNVSMHMHAVWLRAAVRCLKIKRSSYWNVWHQHVIRCGIGLSACSRLAR